MVYNLSYNTWSNREKSALQKVIKSGMFTMGKNVKKFEKKFSNYLGRKYSVMTNSGSSANLISIASFFYKNKNFLKKGDEVIVPAISWSTTYTPLQQYGLKLKFVDIDLDNLNIDLKKLEKSITKKTKMIVSVSILGCPTKLEEINKICKKFNLLHFEDNCESLGAKIKNRKTGTYGDISTHSFFFSHHISTMEGGMLSTDNFEIYCIAKSLRAHGWTRDLPKNNPLINKKKQGIYEEYKFILPGYNVRSGELNAAAGLEQLKKLNKMISIRRKNLNLFNKLFKNHNKFIIQKTNDYHSSFCFPLVLKSKNKTLKNKVLKILSKANIQFRLITGGCFTEHNYSKHFVYSTQDGLPNAKHAHYYGFFVGNSSVNLTPQIKFLYKVLKNI